MSTAGEVVDLSERVRHLEAVETIQIGDGAPTHFAAEGERYWDKDNDALYVNNDGANGWTLIGGGAAGAVPHNILSATHSDSTAATVSRGSIITGQDDAGATTWQELGLGAGNSVLMSDGVDASWQIPGTWWSGGWMPLGGIILWSGSVATIPPNWQLCDGTNGTPNLRDRFVVGAGTSYAVDATGGAVSQDLTHTHGPGTLNTDNDTHDHSVDAGTTANDTHDHSVDAGATGAGSAHNHSMSGSAGPASAPHAQVTADGFAVASTVHTHGVGTYVIGNESAHTHGSGTLDTDNDTHSHGPGTLDTDNDTHDHDVDAGVTGGALGVTSILPPYYALAYIMRMS
jgi:hypothetical protein